jgi:Ca-activated chloride channel homolog
MRAPGSQLTRILVGLLAITCGVRAQAQTAPDRGVYTVSDNVDLVLLDVSVKDSRGGYVTGLSKANFQVSENGHVRQITHFASIDTPVTVGLVVDNSGSMRFKRPEVILAGLTFARESNPKDDFFVVNFNNAVVRGLQSPQLFTDDLQTLRAALYYGQPVGQTALYDAVAYALKILEFSHRDKRTLIVVSDGGDNVSRSSFPELMKLIQASRATIYTVGLYTSDDRDLNPGVLRKMSGASGGEFFQPQSMKEVGPVFDKIAKDIRNCYTVGYAPDEMNDKRVARTVKVTATDQNRKLIVRTRTSYTTTPLSELLAQQGRKQTHAKDQ